MKIITKDANEIIRVHGILKKFENEINCSKFKKRTKIKHKHNTKMSISLSKITWPIREEIGILLDLLSVEHLTISPLLGIIELKRYPKTTECNNLETLTLCPKGSIISCHLNALNTKAKYPRKTENINHFILIVLIVSMNLTNSMFLTDSQKSEIPTIKNIVAVK